MEIVARLLHLLLALVLGVAVGSGEQVAWEDLTEVRVVEVESTLALTLLEREELDHRQWIHPQDSPELKGEGLEGVQGGQVRVASEFLS